MSAEFEIDVCPTGHDALPWSDKRDMSLAAFFAAKRADAAARGWGMMAEGFSEDLALIEMRGLLRQAEGRAA